MSLIAVLIGLLIFCIVVYIVNKVMELPPRVRMIVNIILVVLLVLCMINLFFPFIPLGDVRIGAVRGG